MPALRPDQIADIVEKCLSTYEREVYTDVSMDLQEYTGCDYFLGEGRENYKLKTGPDSRFKIRNSNPGNAWMGGLWQATPAVVAQNNMDEGVTKWFKSECAFAYDEDEPMFMGGSDNEQIIDLLKERLHGAMNDYFTLIEPFWWTAGSDSANRPPGLVDYIVKDATTAPAGDFVGGNPAGYSSGVAGINSNTVTGWQNYAGGYAAVTQKDLFHKVRRACALTNFKPPHAFPELKKGKDRVVIFTTLRASTEIEEQLENRNDNLKEDAIRFADQAMMRSHKVVWVPYLENNDTTDPLYGVNFAHMFAQIHKNVNMKRKEVQAGANESEKHVVKYRRWFGLACTDRRRQWVISKAA